MTQQQANQIEQSPGPLRMAALLLCVLVGLSTLPWMYLALGRFGGFAWGLFGFELIVLMGCAMTALVCLNRVKVGAALPLAIACLMGTILVSMVFGIHVEARSLIGDNHPSVRPWVNRTAMFYTASIGLLGLIAMLDVYRRESKSWGLAIRSGVFLMPVLASVVWMRRSGMPSITDSTGELSPVRMIAVILGGLVFGILLSVGGHFLIRSFEVAVPEKTASDEA